MATNQDIVDAIKQLTSSIESSKGTRGPGNKSNAFGIGGTTGQITNQAIGFVGDALSKSLKAGITQTSQLAQREQFGVNNLTEGVKALKQINSLAGVTNILFGIGNTIVDQVVLQFEQESQLLTDIGEKAGLVGKLAKDLRNEIFDAYPGIVNMGYGFEEVSKYYTNLIEQTGKFTMLNSDVMVKSAETARAFVGDLSEMSNLISQFEKIGIGATDAVENIEEAGLRTLSLGLRSRKVTEDMSKNIEKLNMYGFKNGVQGLADMSRKATEFRMNLEDAFSVAEKVINPEGAVELSAQLQVIGGTIGDFADPLKLMYMATNDVEGLQDALVGAAGSLATYNDEQGKFEVSGANLRRARDMAEALGISLNDLSRSAVATAERTKAASDLLSTGLQMTDEDREFLTNLGTMKDGKMIIQVPESLAKSLGLEETQVNLASMNDKLARGLLDNREAFKAMDSKDVAQAQLTEMGKMERSLNTIAAAARVQIAQYIKVTDVYKGGEEMVKKVNDITGGIASAMIRGEGDFKNKTDVEKRDYLVNLLGEDMGSKIAETVKEMNMNFIEKQQNQQNNQTTQTTTQQPQTTTMQHNVNISVANAGDAMSKAIFTNDYIKSLMQEKRSFTNYVDLVPR